MATTTDLRLASSSSLLGAGGGIATPTPASETAEAAESNPAGRSRQVGFEYVLQTALTSLPLVVFDLAMLILGITTARQTVFLFGGAAGMDLTSCFPPIATGFVLIGAELNLYPGIRLSPVEELRRLTVATACMFLVWAIGLSFLVQQVTFQRWFLLVAFLFSVAALTIGRSVARRVLGKFKWWGYPTLVCGDDAGAVEVYEWLSASGHVGLRPAGVIADPAGLELDGGESWYLGDWSQVESAATEHRAYWALVIPSEDSPKGMTDEVENCLAALPHVQLVSELTGLPDHWGGRRPVDGLEGIHLQQNLLLPGKRFAKRLIDLVVSISATLVLLPALILIALIVKLTSRGPVLYGHKRLGHGGAEFKAWKFRTMVVDADKALERYLNENPAARREWEKDHKLKWDPRITPVGRLFRKLSLDELPQLWNVIRGEMSLVGPRPIVTKEIAKYGGAYRLYTAVKPGITGLWQVSGRNNTTYDERVQLDEYYVRNWSPWLDAYLLLRTIRTVLFTEGAY